MEIRDILLTIGVTANIMGYDYIQTAVAETQKSPKLLERITGGLYPAVAAIHGTTASKVERAIRHAIGIAHNKDGFQKLNEIIGVKVYAPGDWPCNGELIALLAKRCGREGKKA